MKVMISAGEASGDIHAAKLVEALRSNAAQANSDTPTPECFGMGGKRLAESGVEILVDVEKSAVMGILEVLHKYPSLRANLATLRNALQEREPDVLVLVDYPHFNMKLAATARELGIPVLFFIAPKVWASRPGRVSELKKLVDHMALILPFESKIFTDAGIPCTYVGNPLLDNKALIKEAGAPHSNNESATKQIALLPGSRKSEISTLLGPMLDTCKALLETDKSYNFVLPVADTINRKEIAKLIAARDLSVTLIESTDYQSLGKSQAAIVASGTATLELAILGIPMVVVYKLNAFSYKVIKRILITKYISLVNIMADKEVVPEILQDDVTGDNLAKEILTLLNNTETRDKQLQGLRDVYQQLGQDGASDRTAALIMSLVKEKTAVPA